MFYVFHGDDSHSQHETLQKLIAKMGDPEMLDLNTTRLEGAVTFTALQQASSAMPFLAKYRLTIVKDLFSSKPPKSLVDQIIDYLPQLPDSTRLFFLESKTLPKNSRLLKLAEQSEKGFARGFNLPEGAALDRWIREQVAARNGRIQPRAVNDLSVTFGSMAKSGNNKAPILEILANELDKLVLFKGEDEITIEDVALLSPYAAQANIFDLVDAIGNRNSKQASLLLQKKLSEGADPFSLFPMIVRQFRLLIQVKALAETGSRPPAISQTLKLHSFVTGKVYQQSQGFSLTQLEKIYSHLLDIDVGVKSGRQDMTTALNLLVAGLTLSN